RKLHREPLANADPILGTPDELHGGWDFKIAAVAGRSNCSWNAGRVNPHRWIGFVSSIYLRQDGKSIFDPPLCAGGSRGLAFSKACCSRRRTPGSSSPRTQRV